MKIIVTHKRTSSGASYGWFFRFFHSVAVIW